VQERAVKRLISFTEEQVGSVPSAFIAQIFVWQRRNRTESRVAKCHDVVYHMARAQRLWALLYGENSERKSCSVT
jgi:hypothetical protein